MITYDCVYVRAFECAIVHVCKGLLHFWLLFAYSHSLQPLQSRYRLLSFAHLGVVHLFRHCEAFVLCAPRNTEKCVRHINTHTHAIYTTAKTKHLVTKVILVAPFLSTQMPSFA